MQQLLLAEPLEVAGQVWLPVQQQVEWGELTQYHLEWGELTQYHLECITEALEPITLLRVACIPRVVDYSPCVVVVLLQQQVDPAVVTQQEQAVRWVLAVVLLLETLSVLAL